jgi:Sel1 repeat
MSWIAPILTLQLTCAVVVAATDYPLRRFGTNIFDFTPVIGSVERGEVTNSPYLVVGQVLQVAGNCAHIVHQTDVRFRYRGPDAYQLQQARPGDLLVMAAAAGMSGTNGISIGHYLNMSPEMRENFERVIQYKRVMVTNCPTAHQIRGKNVQFYAMPAGKYTFVDASGQAQTIPFYDYGQPFIGEVSTNSRVFLVTRAAIVKRETPHEVAAKKATLTANLIAWQQQQATNGVAYVQYELAERYLNGDGVAKDRAAAVEWLRRAAAQDYGPATSLLKTIEKPSE